MKRFYGVMVGITAVFAAMFIVTNLLLAHADKPENGRPYRVEINRLALTIEHEGFESLDLSECEYVTNVAEYSEGFYSSASDCAVREINGRLYRFDYDAHSTVRSLAPIIVNVSLGAALAVTLAVMLYIRARILRPFRRLSDVPRELAKGNLTVPLKETRGKYFGRFVWGVDMLRETLEQQKQRELELQKEKKTLLLSLSHDIKTPLSAIKLYAQALSKNLYPDPEKQCAAALKINEHADEIEHYVSQITDASREDIISLEVNIGEFYISALVSSIAEVYAEKFALQKTELVIGKYRDKLLSGDLDRSAEVLQNLLENALKYGSGERVELLFGEEEDCTLISVMNGGCTLEKEELAHIFESFWRGGNSSDISGSGLGLYICRNLMRKMGGEVFAKLDGDIITVTAVWGQA